jgi:hypothetical protein
MPRALVAPMGCPTANEATVNGNGNDKIKAFQRGCGKQASTVACTETIINNNTSQDPT